jgi:2-dehydropantoate 2-reductase
VQFVPDIAKRVWEKVFVNVGINPFAAIARVPNGELLKDPQMRAAMEGAVEEAVAVAWEKKVDLSGIDPVGAMFDVAEKTVNNRNSMLQDIEKGKPTEIMFLNGKIAEWGTQLEVPTPINSTLTALIKILERLMQKK